MTVGMIPKKKKSEEYLATRSSAEGNCCNAVGTAAALLDPGQPNPKHCVQRGDSTLGAFIWKQRREIMRHKEYRTMSHEECLFRQRKGSASNTNPNICLKSLHLKEKPASSNLRN